jgi:hypothetical protein
MRSWGPWLLFAVGILMIFAALVDAGSAQRHDIGARVEGADVVVMSDFEGTHQTRYVREVVAGEIPLVCGSLLMIAGVALPRLGRSRAETTRLYEAERISDGIE